MSAPKDRAELAAWFAHRLCDFNRQPEDCSRCSADDGKYNCGQFFEDGAFLVAAIEAAGLRIVPVKATPAMIDASEAAFENNENEWPTMVAASPYAPPGELT